MMLRLLCCAHFFWACGHGHGHGGGGGGRWRRGCVVVGGKRRLLGRFKLPAESQKSTQI